MEKRPKKNSKEAPALSAASSFLDWLPDAGFLIDPSGRITHGNACAATLCGVSMQELVGSTLHGYLPPKERKELIAFQDDAVLKGRGLWIGPWTIASGNSIIVDLRAIRQDDDSVLIVARDVRTFGAALPLSPPGSDQAPSLFELCHEAVVISDPLGIIQSWNSAAESLFGYSSQEVLGRPIQMLMPDPIVEVGVQSFASRVGRAASGEFGRTIYTIAKHKDGHEVPVSISVNISHRSGNSRITAMIHDVSERETIIEQLNDALQRLQFHVERMPLAYIIWDTDFRVLEWNPAAERIFGYSRAEAIGRHSYELIVPPEIVPTIDVIWSDLLAGDTSSHSINSNIRKDESRITCEWFNTPLSDSHGKIRGVASMVMDVSEREQLEDQIRTTQKLESLAVMASGIAHDFNSSLMVILGNTALLRSLRNLPGRAMEHLELIEDAGSRASQLIKHLLSYARTGRHNPQTTDLNTVIRDAMALIQSSIGKQHEIKLDLAMRLPTIVADRSQLEQIVFNLCLNAKQAMPHGGEISVSTKQTVVTTKTLAQAIPHGGRPGTYLEMTVADSGCGIDAKALSRIFDPFYTTKPDGHGLGLAAVLGILRQHSGFACVETRIDKGTKMRVYLPVGKSVGGARDVAATTRSRFNASKATLESKTAKPA